MSDSLIDVQIDGKWMQFPKGTRMIEALREAGKLPPHYCYHPKLSSPGNCRMCLIEMGMPPRPAPGQDPPEKDQDGHLPIQWMPRPVISCANTVAPNMGIRTDSEKVVEWRNGVMEFLLANHPLDCPICDQAGECRLQEFSVGHGRGHSRFREQKVKKPKNVPVGPAVRLDVERCVMCSRCIRFCDEVVEDPVLGFTDRGSHTVLDVHPGRELDQNYALNTVDICPVGALTSNDFRFQMRVWFLKETNTIDVNCGTGCNIVVWTRGNEIYRITPRRNDEVNSTWMPDSHRLSFHALQGDHRLTEPLLRDPAAPGAGATNPSPHRVAQWPEAIGRLALELKGFEPGEIAIVASARMTNEELYLARKLRAALGVGLLDVVPRQGEADELLISADRNPNTEGAKLVLGLKTPGSGLNAIRQGIADGRIKAVLALQEDLLSQQAGFTSEQLGKLDLLASLHLATNDTAGAAHVVLPGASFAEKSGTMINVSGRLQKLNRAIQPPGRAMDDWEILRDLIQALGAGNGLYQISEVFKAMADDLETLREEGIGWADIGDLGHPLIDTGVRIPLIEKERRRREHGHITG